MSKKTKLKIVFWDINHKNKGIAVLGFSYDKLSDRQKDAIASLFGEEIEVEHEKRNLINLKIIKTTKKVVF